MINNASTLIFLFLLFIAATIFITILKKKKDTKGINYPYQQVESLFSNAEQLFLISLEIALDNEFRIFGKIRIEDLIKVKKGTSNKIKTGARNRIKSRHVDFILCDKENFKIIAAIELDDNSHNTKRAKKQDEIKNNIFKAASLPLIRFKASNSYNEQEIKNKIKKILE